MHNTTNSDFDTETVCGNNLQSSQYGMSVPPNLAPQMMKSTSNMPQQHITTLYFNDLNQMLLAEKQTKHIVDDTVLDHSQLR